VSECKRREEWEVRSDLKGGNEQSLVEWWLAKGAIGLTGNLRLRVLGKNASGRVASCLLDEIHSRSALLHYKKKRESFPMQQNVVPFFPTCGALSPLTGHHLQHLTPEGTWSSTVALGRAEVAPAHTPLAAQDEEGESESAASGTTLLFVVVLRVRTYRTRELQPEHWSLLTYHELAKSWLPTVSKSKYPWCCARV